MTPGATFNNMEEFYSARGGNGPGGECDFGRYHTDDLDWSDTGGTVGRRRVSVVYDTGDVTR